MKPVLITSYTNPDLDGVSCVIAYSEFLNKAGKETEIGVFGEPHEEARYVLNRFGIPYPQRIPNMNDFDEVILVDSSDPNSFEDGQISPEKVVEIIDHREIHNAEKFPNAETQIELVGAAATLIAEKFMENKIDISKESATLLYGAIISNTLNFKGSVTTDRDKKSAEWLNGTAKLPEDFWKELFTAKSDLSGKKLNEEIEGDLSWFITVGGKKIGIAQIEIMGVEKLLKERGNEVIQLLEKGAKELSFDFIFLNAVELEDNKNFFVTSHAKTQKLLEKILSVKFIGSIAERPGMILRKQIIPLLKKELE